MTAVIVVVLVGCFLGTLAKGCEITVSESMVKRLSHSNHSDEPCNTLWTSLENQYRNARANMSVCLERQLAVGNREPSVFDCQRELENVKLDIQGDHDYYARTMRLKTQLNEMDVKKHQQAKATLQHRIAMVGKDFTSYYRDLIFLNIGAGSSKEAIKYYHRYLAGQPPGPLLNDIVASVYRDPAYENERFAYLLDFVRKMAGSSLKLSLYNIIYPAMKQHPNQRDSYLAMMLALDVGRMVYTTQNDAKGRQLYLDIFQPALAHLKRAVQTGNYDEIVTFATKYSNHFEEIENQLATIDTGDWDRTDFNRLVTYPNRLPLAKQRLEAFRMLVLQINQRNKHNFADRLAKVAPELEQCETFIRSGKSDQSVLDKLGTVKGLFAKLDPNRDYDHYLTEGKKQ